jgi:hypothetical protein
MKRIPAALLFSLMLCVVQNCKKTNASSNNNNNNNTPQTTAVGSPTGTATSKFIPKSGGSITSADGKIEIDFPNGALPADDTITIQPITNNCAGGIGTGYRLSPEGLQFSQPVTLKFHYDDSVLQSTLSGLMGIAFQDSIGRWNMLKNSTNDTVNHIISATIQHFSDWTSLEEAEIIPDHGTLKTNQQISIRVTSDISNEEGTGEASSFISQESSATIQWFVNGVPNGNSQYGTITNGPNTNGNDNVIYTAPATVPPSGKNPVVITAQIQGNFHDVETNLNISKVILFARFVIFGNGYHIELDFKADSVNEGGAYYNMTDKSTFDILQSGGAQPWTVTHIVNNNTLLTYLYNDGTCTVTTGPDAQGPIQVQDSGIVIENPILNNFTVSFGRSLNPEYYVLFPSWISQCGTDLNTLGGGLGPSFPAVIQFNSMDPISTAVQTITSGQYTILVTVIQ